MRENLVLGYMPIEGKLVEFDLLSGKRKLMPLYTRGMQAIGYNPIDQFLYGIERQTNWLLRLGYNGTIQSVGTIAALPVPSYDGYNMGTFDQDGYYYIACGGANHYYVIDVNSARPQTYLKLVDPRGSKPYLRSDYPYAIPFEEGYCVQRGIWGYNPNDQLIYVWGHSVEGQVLVDPHRGKIVGGSMSNNTMKNPTYIVNKRTANVNEAGCCGEESTRAPLGRQYWSQWTNQRGCDQQEVAIEECRWMDEFHPSSADQLPANKGSMGTDQQLFYGRFSQYAEKSVVAVGDEVQCIITIDNESEQRLLAVKLYTDLPDELSFVSGSLHVGNQPYWGKLEEGVILSEIEGQGVVTLTYKVKAEKLSTEQMTPIVATMEYARNGQRKVQRAADIEIKVCQGKIEQKDIIMEVKPSYGVPGDLIEHRITITNSGNWPIQWIELFPLYDQTAEEWDLQQVERSGTIIHGSSPLQWEEIKAGQRKTIQFRTKVRAERGIEKEPCFIQYGYEMEGTAYRQQCTVDLPEIEVAYNDVQMVKEATHEYSLIGEWISYQISIENKGNIDCRDLVVQDKIPEGITNISHLECNGKVVQGELEEGLYLGRLKPAEKMVIRYQGEVTAHSQHEDGEVHQARLNYHVVYPWNDEVVSGEALSNRLIHMVYPINISQQIKYDKEAFRIGQSVLCQITVQNKGKKKIEQYGLRGEGYPKFSLEGLQCGGIEYEGDIAQGIFIGSLESGQEKRIECYITANQGIDFAPWEIEGLVKVGKSNHRRMVTLPIESPELHVVDPKLRTELVCSHHHVALGDQVMYQLMLANDGEIEYQRLVIHPGQLETMTFEPEVLIDGIKKKVDDWSKGIEINELMTGQQKVIQLYSRVQGSKQGEFSQQMRVLYYYELDNENYIGTLLSETHQLHVAHVSCRLDAELSPLLIAFGERIKGKVVLINDGEIDLFNLRVKGEFPLGLTYIPGTLRINGKKAGQEDLFQGLVLEELKIKEQVKFTYEAEALTGMKEQWGEQKNEVNFFYQLENGAIGQKEISNTLAVQSTVKTMKVIGEDYVCHLVAEDGEISEISHVISNIQIDDYYIIPTIAALDRSGKIHKGAQANINGEIDFTIQYIVDGEQRVVQSSNYSFPLGESLLLPLDYREGAPVEITAELTHLDYQWSGGGRVVIHHLIRLAVKFLNGV